MKKTANVIVIIIFISIIFGIYILAQNEKVRNENKMAETNINVKEKKNEKAKDFVLKDLNDKEIKLSDYKGKKVFITFWTTWCSSCKVQLPYINEVAKEQNEDLEIITISSRRI
ncbi:MAG: TlpA disulfide reductase family protein [Clostridia bacterium]|nr:TlpA disulfide reductase family protein [Clostridia bacterium]MDD4375824.1 TlpA disulfide reductase family protein [Clostridia bacterium]